MHDGRFHSSLRTKLVVRGALYCVWTRNYAVLKPSVKKELARAPCPWRNGLLPYNIVCASLVTIPNVMRTQRKVMAGAVSLVNLKMKAVSRICIKGVYTPRLPTRGLEDDGTLPGVLRQLKSGRMAVCGECIRSLHFLEIA